VSQRRKHPLAICEQCPLYDQDYVPSHLPEDAQVIAVGEGPGSEEVREGVPFVGPSGKLLSIAIENEGYDPTKLAKTNVVSCRPPGNRTPTPEEEACCHPRLAYELDLCPDATILALGKTAALTLTGEFTVGSWHDTIMSTWHPAYVLRQPKNAQRMITDIRRAFEGPKPQPLFVHQWPEPLKVRSVARLEEELAKCPAGSWVSVDFETDNVVWYDRPDKKADAVLQYGISWDDRYGIVLQDDMLYDVPGTIEVLQRFHDREDIFFVGQNVKYDAIFARAHFGLKIRADFDTMLAHYILDENSRHGLKDLAADEFGMADYEAGLVQKHLKSRNDSYSKVPEDDLAQYLALDLATTNELGRVYRKRLADKNLYEWPYYNVMMRAHEAMIQQEMKGLHVDIPYLKEAQKYMDKKLEDLEDEAGKMSGHDGINLRSPQQVAEVVYDDLKFPPCKVRKLGPRSTAHDALHEYIGKGYEFIDLLFYYRRIHKLKRSYLDNMIDYADVNGTVHPTVWMHGTEMGRLAMRDPAAQTIPRPGQKVDFPVGHKYFDSPYTTGAIIRGAVIPEPGKALIVADYSQAELRTVGALSMDAFLLKVYEDGRDLHTEVAIEMFGPNFTKEQRVQCKMFNFSYIYGGNEYSFAMDAGLPINKARAFVRRYNEVMPQLAQYRVDQYNFLVEHGYVETRTGRRRRFPLITNQNRDDARKASVHAPVAGTASDMTLLSACQLIEEGYDVRLTVHDSVIVTIDQSEAEEFGRYVVQVMEDTARHFIPEVRWKADAEIRTRWAEPPSFS
jgi:uracil-DNA glycosylase family 4